MKGSYLRAEEVTSDMYASIEAVTNTLEAQLKKHRNKIIKKVIKIIKNICHSSNRV